MSDTNLGWKAAALAIAVAASVGILGCESFTTYCEDQNSCHDGNEQDLEACIVDKEHESEAASEFGCGDEFSTFQDCVEEKAECNNDVFGLDGDDCEDESREYSKCRFL